MININKIIKEHKLFLLSSLLCLFPIIIGLFIYDSLPMQIPIHWNINGEIDNYSSKFFAIIILPFCIFIFDFIMKLFIINDPKKKVYPKPLMFVISLILPIINIIIFIIQLLQTKDNQSFSVNKVMFIFIGILFIIIGIYLPKVEQNYTIGVKIPWTLNDEKNWSKTHKVCGYTFIISGILFVIDALFISSATLSTFIIIFNIGIIIIIPTAYSFFIYKNLI